MLAGVIMAARIEEFITLKDFMKNMALIGALLMMLAISQPWAWSL